MESPTQETRVCKPFSSYSTWGDFDRAKAEQLHALTWEFRERLLTDHALQNLLLNAGYEYEGERPTSYCALYDATLRRTAVGVQLMVLERMVDLVTHPSIVALQERSPILASDEAPLLFSFQPRLERKREVVTSQGYSAEVIEQYQRLWMGSPEVVEQVRAFEKALNATFDEYNLKYVAGRMHRALAAFMNVPCEEIQLQKRIQGVFEGNVYCALDNAYYNAGNRLLSYCAEPWQQLQTSEFGKMFTMSKEEVQESVGKTYSGRED